MAVVVVVTADDKYWHRFGLLALVVVVVAVTADDRYWHRFGIIWHTLA